MGSSKGFAIVAFEDYLSQQIVIQNYTGIDLSASSLKELEKKNIAVLPYGPKKVIPHTKELREFLDITEPGEIAHAFAADYIFLSNIFDKRQEFEFERLYNLSTNFLLKEDTTAKQNVNIPVATISMIETHRHNEIQRQINFINAFKSNYKEYIGFPLPSSINASLVPESDYREQDGIFETKAYYFLRDFKEYINERLGGLPPSERLLFNVSYREYTMCCLNSISTAKSIRQD